MTSAASGNQPTGDRREAPDCFMVHFDRTLSGGRVKGFYELDDEVAYSKAAVVRNLIEGQFENVDYILKLSFDGPSGDCSLEIAEAVVTRCIDAGDPIPSFLTNFIERHYGVFSLAEMKEEYPYLEAAE